MPLKSWSEMMKDAEETTSGFQPLEAGESYTFVIEKPAELGETSKGHPKFTVRAVVESGPRKNATQIHRFNVTDSGFAMKRFFFEPLYAMGLSPAFFETNPSSEAIAQAFQGKRFVALVEKQKDSEYTQLVNFAPATGAAPAAGVPSGLPSNPAPMTQAAPAQAAPAQQQVPAAAPAAPAAPAVDANPWATTPPPAPAF